MNLAAYEENERNKRHITRYDNQGRTCLVVDGSKVTYRGMKIRDLSDAQKRKYETLLLLTNIKQTGMPKIVYR